MPSAMICGNTPCSVLVECPECRVVLVTLAPFSRKKKGLYYTRCGECFNQLRVDVRPLPPILRGAGSYVTAAVHQHRPIQECVSATAKVANSDIPDDEAITVTATVLAGHIPIRRAIVLDEHITIHRVLTADELCLDLKHLQLATAPRFMIHGQLKVFKYTEIKAHALRVHGSEAGIVAAVNLRTDLILESERRIEERLARREALAREVVNGGLVGEMGNAVYVETFDYCFNYGGCDVYWLVQCFSEEKYLREYIDDNYIGPLRVARDECFTFSKCRYAEKNYFCADPNEHFYGVLSKCWPAKWPWLSHKWSRDTHATFPVAFRRRIRTLLLCLKVKYADVLPDDIVDLIVKQAATTL